MSAVSSRGGKKMWCVPKLDAEYIERMESLLDLYAKPYDEKEPVVCIDEKSKQLLKNVRAPMLANERSLRKVDYEYKRNGTRNIFCAVEPKGGHRKVAVTKRRTKADFAQFVRELLDVEYKDARKVHIVCDNLNTHFVASFQETFDAAEAQRILSRIEFHYTPKHASWLDMAEIELSILSRTAIKGRVSNEAALIERANRFQESRNSRCAMINWTFTTQDARRALKYEVGN
jgi:hypothetical protein